MGRTANMIIKDSIHIFASISKSMHILLMGLLYLKRCVYLTITIGLVVRFCHLVNKGSHGGEDMPSKT